ncbi:hypothetical protein G6162_001531 [Salmonella enterica]|nr:hypothetical protein [Salmonella enterica]EAN8610397.1 hypothetical protein [Salmonella enterica subsp. arizonae serovar 48:z4,z24:-]EAT8889924.1 hypothetical protein [Salmonella enterica subsp. arizonae serovar 53:z4,z23,z32:-]EBH9975643.1 hypothetical protein [Salmonella enterica subsp. arizonae serovar 40:z36:-]ECF5976314.1 hypothetical protein [Salmonella enterica subsp. arizonae]EDU1604116.1 hypothetical protein [Salmonella enterica subsp. houtenae serovar 48:g,z51:-]EDU8174589.1 hypo
MKSVHCGASGLAQRVIKLIKKQPLTNSELARLLNIDEVQFYKESKSFLRKAKSYEIVAGDIFINASGNKDRAYSLIRHEPKKATPKRMVNFNSRGDSMSRVKGNKAAVERRKLIIAGKYNGEEERKLCEKYGF